MRKNFRNIKPADRSQAHNRQPIKEGYSGKGWKIKEDRYGHQKMKSRRVQMRPAGRQAVPSFHKTQASVSDKRLGCGQMIC